MPVLQPSIRIPSSCKLWAKRGEWGSSRAGMGTHCLCAHPVPCESLVQDPGTNAWGTDRCWIPALLLIVVVQPWFTGVLAFHLLCWTSPSYPSQSLTPSCTCWCLHSRTKFRKNWLSPQMPVATDIHSKAPVKQSSPKNYFFQSKWGPSWFFLFSSCSFVPWPVLNPLWHVSQFIHC